LLARAWVLAFRRHETHSARHAEVLNQQSKGESIPKTKVDAQLPGQSQELQRKEQTCVLCNMIFADVKALRA
jgi:hypothetical protein